MFGSKIDLHMHSLFSDDGEFTPTQLVQQCKEAGIKTMSIADHNSAKANAEARKEAKKSGIKYISGIEIDCVFQGLNLHVLGYEIDESSPDFAKLEEYITTGERKASWGRLDLTRQLGFEISEAELNAISNVSDGTGVWTGEAFAEVLLEKEEFASHPLLLPYREGGARSDNPLVNFYWDYYAQGKPCYVKVDFPDIKEAIAIIKNNGGKAILAHPGNNLKGKFELLDEIIKTGIDGIEVFCTYHDKATAQHFYEQALKHSLIITSGSDYHGKIKPAVKLGETGCWLEQVTLYHGGDKEMQIKDITFPGPRPDCDFGQGFYLTPDKEIAEEWVRKRNSPVISMYKFTYSTEDAHILRDSQWLQAIIGCRENAYPVSFSKNIVIGGIANDRLFPMLGMFMDATLIVGIGDKRLLECLSLVQLGDQFALKTSAEGLTFIDSYELKGELLEGANERHALRQRGMNEALSHIRRKNYENEKFVDDFIEECKNGIAF